MISVSEGPPFVMKTNRVSASNKNDRHKFQSTGSINIHEQPSILSSQNTHSTTCSRESSDSFVDSVCDAVKDSRAEVLDRASSGDSFFAVNEANSATSGDGTMRTSGAPECFPEWCVDSLYCRRGRSIHSIAAAYKFGVVSPSFVVWRQKASTESAVTAVTKGERDAGDTATERV